LANRCRFVWSEKIGPATGSLRILDIGLASGEVGSAAEKSLGAAVTVMSPVRTIHPHEHWRKSWHLGAS